MVPTDPEYRVDKTAPVAAAWWRQHLAAVEPFSYLSPANMDAVESAIRRAILVEWASRFPYHNASWPEDVPPVEISCLPAPNFLLAEALAGIEFPELPVTYQKLMKVPVGVTRDFLTRWEEQKVTLHLDRQTLIDRMATAHIGMVKMLVSQASVVVDVNGVTSGLAVNDVK